MNNDNADVASHVDAADGDDAVADDDGDDYVDNTLTRGVCLRMCVVCHAVRVQLSANISIFAFRFVHLRPFMRFDEIVGGSRWGGF